MSHQIPAAGLALPPAQSLVLALLCARLHRRDGPALPSAETISAELLEFSRVQRVALLLYDFLKDRPQPLPASLLTRLKKLYLFTAAHNQRFESELLALIHLFASESIPLMPLKGVALSRFLYGDPALRPGAVVGRADRRHFSDGVRVQHGVPPVGLLRGAGYELFPFSTAVLLFCRAFLGDIGGFDCDPLSDVVRG